MRSEFKSATQIYANPIYVEILLIFRIDLVLHTRTWWPKSMNRKNCPKCFHRVIFVFWIQICNPNLCKSHTFWNTANIARNPDLIFFRIPRSDDQNWWNRKNCPKFFHRVIFAFSAIQICNPNLCKSHTFWYTANIAKWFFFAYPDLMTKIDEIGKIARKIARNSFIENWPVIFARNSEFKSATQIYVNPIHFEIQLILKTGFFSHTRTWWPKSMKSKKLPKILS